MNKDIIVVIGQANNAKAGAVVISKDDKKMYYLDGVAAWEDKIIGKNVKVTGNLLVEKHDPPKAGEPVKQEIVGTVRTILKPKWELVK